MKHLLFFILLISGMSSFSNFCSAQSEKYVGLKLDDVIAGTDGTIISDRWQRVTDYLEEKKIKAAYGIIGFSLKSDNPEYFKWITNLANGGLIEFWNHGFWRRTLNDSLGEFERSYEEQMYSLKMTDSLARTKLGINLPTWGPHWSGTNEHTDFALSKMSQIKMTFGYPQNPIHFKGVVLPYRISLEYPTHNLNFEVFKKNYLNKKDELDYFYLQGHPMSWDNNSWDNFVKTIEFLKSENVHFVTPSELMEIIYSSPSEFTKY